MRSLLLRKSLALEYQHAHSERRF